MNDEKASRADLIAKTFGQDNRFVFANQFNVSESALRIIEQRPRCWPGDLFFRVLIDEVDACRHLLSSPIVGTRPKVELAAFDQWLRERLDSFSRIVMDFQTWLHSDFVLYFSPSSEGDAARDGVCRGFAVPVGAPTEGIAAIIAMPCRAAAVYRQAIEWQHSVRNADVHPVLREATYELSFRVDPLLRKIECLGPAFLALLESHRDPTKAGLAAEAVKSWRSRRSCPGATERR